MTPELLETLLERLRTGDATVKETSEALRSLPFESVGNLARIDHHRTLRTGCPEVVFGASKTAEEIADLLLALDKGKGGALATKVSPRKADRVLQILGRGTHNPLASTIVLEPPTQKGHTGTGTIGLVCAGTSDRFVLEEALVTLSFLGHATKRFDDVGVAGLHRILQAVPQLEDCSALVVVAGMEGALPTVVAGLVHCPIIAVPSSVGYGVAAGGFAALAGMLASCAPGVTVVNIDNGFGAAIAAARINCKKHK